MVDENKEVWPDAVHEPAAGLQSGPIPAVSVPPTREAMSWIRALANDWEDARSQSEATK